MTKKQVLHAAAFVLCAVLAISAASRVLVHKNSEIYYGWTLKEDSSADVMFFGASHIKAGVQVGELWQQYGITAYNCGVAGQAMGSTYWQMREVFAQKLPRVAVVDVHTLSWNTAAAGTGTVHNTFDCIPLNADKVRAAFALTDPGERLEVLFPIIQFHSRWEDLTKDDFVEPEQIFGESAGGQVTKYYETDPLLPQSETDGQVSEARKALADIAELCREKGVALVLTQMPGPNTEFQQRQLNGAAAVAAEYDIPYVDFQRLDVVNLETDFRDLGWTQETDEFAYHINASGAKKVTDWFGSFFAEQYGLADHRGETGYELWQQKGEKYLDQKLNILMGTDDLYSYLNLLADPDVSACIVIPAGSELCADPLAKALLANLGLSPDWEALEQKSYLGITDPVNGRVEQITTDADTALKCYMGTVRFTGDMQGRYRNPGLEFALVDYSLRVYNDIDPQPPQTDLQILLFDNRTALPVQCVTFDNLNRNLQYTRSETPLAG